MLPRAQTKLCSGSRLHQVTQFRSCAWQVSLPPSLGPTGKTEAAEALPLVVPRPGTERKPRKARGLQKQPPVDSEFPAPGGTRNRPSPKAPKRPGGCVVILSIKREQPLPLQSSLNRELAREPVDVVNGNPAFKAPTSPFSARSFPPPTSSRVVLWQPASTHPFPFVAEAAFPRLVPPHPLALAAGEVCLGFAFEIQVSGRDQKQWGRGSL